MFKSADEKNNSRIINTKASIWYAEIFDLEHYLFLKLRVLLKLHFGETACSSELVIFAHNIQPYFPTKQRLLFI